MGVRTCRTHSIQSIANNRKQSKSMAPQENTEDVDKLNLDDLISRLLTTKGTRTAKDVHLTESEIKGLCFKAKEIFLSQPPLLELEAPLKICGRWLLSLPIFAHSSWEFRRHSWPVSGSSPSVRVWSEAPWCELPVPWRLRR